MGIFGKGRRSALTLAAMSLGFSVVQLDVTIVNGALPRIGAALGGGVAALQLVVSAYTVSFAALILGAGALGDRVRAKSVFVAGFALFTAASLGCALAPSLPLLVAARAAQGAGAALLVPNSLALLNHAYEDEAGRARAVGIWAAGASLALTAGPILGGVLIAACGWRSIFLVNLPLGLAGLALAWVNAAQTPRAAARGLDLPGQALAVLALGLLAAAMIGGGGAGWADARVDAGLAVSLAAFGGFLLRERRAAAPMLPLGLFRIRAFGVSALLGLLLNTVFYGSLFVLSLYLQRARGLSPLGAGLAFIPMMAGVFAANLAAARAAKAAGARGAIAAGIGGMALGTALLLGLGPQAGWGRLVVAFLALGGGLGLLVPPLTAVMLASVEKPRSGAASGVLNAMRQTGSVIGVALFGALSVGQEAAIGLALLLAAFGCALALRGASPAPSRA